MPSRILRDYRDSVTMANLTDFQERLFVRMIMTADDFGRGLANNLHATCFQVSDISRATVMKAANELQNVGLVRLYTDADGRLYFDIPKFGNKPRAKHSKCPTYEECKQVASKLQASCGQLHADCSSKPRTENRYSETENREPGTETESCGQAGNTALPPEASAVVMFFPCSGTGALWPLTQAMLDGWSEAYPAVDVLAECRKAKAWEDSNPKNRKTFDGHARFLNAWMSKSQNQARTGPAQGQPAAIPEKPRGTWDIKEQIELLRSERDRLYMSDFQNTGGPERNPKRYAEWLEVSNKVRDLQAQIASKP